MTQKAERKALKREYLERTHPMGVFRVFNSVNGKSFVGTSTNLPAMLNRQKAQLQLQAHMNKTMQQDWNQHGPDAFRFEVLDTLTPPDRVGYDPTNDLRTLEQLWLDKLSPFGDQGYN